jgi:hypothetical protein
MRVAPQPAHSREHGIIDAIAVTRFRRSPTPPTRAQVRRSRSHSGERRLEPDTGRYRRLSKNQKDINAAHTRRRGPGERINAELKNWRILRKIRSSPSRARELIAAVQTLVIANA